MSSSSSSTVDIRGDLRQCPDCARRFSGDAAFCPFDGVPLAAAGTPGSAPWIDPLVGSTIDARYEVLAILGEGGMGRVYRVRHTSLQRMFAMKVLRSDLAAHDDLSARFLHEARATAAVKHPNVVQITDFGRLPDGVPYFVMELLSGQTLTEALRVRPFPTDRIVPILRQLASALGAAHAAGVVHRDLKPDNVFLVGAPDAMTTRAQATPSQVWPIAPELRVVDFGAAKILGTDRITRAGVVFGTPHYMSPEQASGEATDHRADVYALGVILYEMLAGRVPFEADTYMGVLSQHMFSPLKPPSAVAAAVKEHGALEAIALRCLAKRPDDRFESMEALLSALDGVDRAAVAGPSGASPSGGSRVADGSDGVGSIPMRRSPVALWVAAGAAGVFGVGAVLAALALAARSPPVAPAGPPTTAAFAASAPAAWVPPQSPSNPEIPAAAPPALPPVVSSGPSTSPAPPPRRPPLRRAPAPAPGGPLDDVGDPFTRPRPR
jgi:serine/threonine-protein kinase